MLFRSGMSTTGTLNAPATNRQGYIWSAQSQAQWRKYSDFSYEIPDTGEPGETVRIDRDEMFIQLPTTGGEVKAFTSKPYEGMAEKGFYSPLAFSNGQQDFTSNLVKVYRLRVRLPDGDVTTFFIGDGTNAQPVMSETMNYSVTLVTGLDPAASFELKFVHHWEVKPSPKSFLNPFCSRTAPPDAAAIHAASLVRHHMPDGMEASMNKHGFFNVLKKLGTGASHAFQILKPVIHPFVRGPVANTVFKAADGITGAVVNHKSEQTKKKVKTVKTIKRR